MVDAVLEYRCTCDVSSVSALLQWCKQRKEGKERKGHAWGHAEGHHDGAPATSVHPRCAYVRLSSRSVGHHFLERFEEQLTSLPLDVDDWTLADWGVLCGFHPKFHYGHLLPAVVGLREGLVGAMIERCLCDGGADGGADGSFVGLPSPASCCIDLRPLQPLAAFGIEATHPSLANYRMMSEGHFLVHRKSNEVRLSLGVSVDFPRACDLFAAALVAHLLGLESVSLVYLDADRRVEVLPEPATWDLVAQVLKLSAVA